MSTRWGSRASARSASPARSAPSRMRSGTRPGTAFAAFRSGSKISQFPQQRGQCKRQRQTPVAARRSVPCAGDRDFAKLASALQEESGGKLSMYDVGQEEIDAIAQVIRSGALFRYGI